MKPTIKKAVPYCSFDCPHLHKVMGGGWRECRLTQRCHVFGEIERGVVCTPAVKEMSIQLAWLEDKHANPGITLLRSVCNA